MFSYIKLRRKHYLNIIFMFSYHYFHYIIITTIIITVIVPLLFHYHSIPSSLLLLFFLISIIEVHRSVNSASDSKREGKKRERKTYK